MAIERTLSIIKPDAVAKNVIGEIYTRFEQAGLKIVASKMMQLTDETAGGFYAEHQGKGFHSFCGAGNQLFLYARRNLLAQLSARRIRRLSGSDHET